MLLVIAPLITARSAQAQSRLTPHHVTLANGKSFTLNLPDRYDITPAVQGLKRVRFMAKSPDNRIFVTDSLALSSTYARIPCSRCQPIPPKGNS